MTGFGKAERIHGDISTAIEIKSLNGKQLDLNLKIPPMLRPYEFELRNRIQQSVVRGSVDVTITIRQNGATRPMVINTTLARHYYQHISTMAKDLGLPEDDVLGALLKLPEVVSPSTEEIAPGEWAEVQEVLSEALESLDTHRLNEGASLEKDLLLRMTNIEAYRQEVERQEPRRRERIRQRLDGSLEEWISKENLDRNRLEQELLYYIEKLDISEELVRLANHLRYFHEMLGESERATGKRLNFVLQEIGREINTTGAKANDALIQQSVVKMKDELEKAKEQIMNVL